MSAPVRLTTNPILVGPAKAGTPLIFFDQHKESGTPAYAKATKKFAAGVFS